VSAENDHALHTVHPELDYSGHGHTVNGAYKTEFTLSLNVGTV